MQGHRATSPQVVCVYESVTKQLTKTHSRLLLLLLYGAIYFFSPSEKTPQKTLFLFHLSRANMSPPRHNLHFDDQSLEWKLQLCSSSASHSNTVVLISAPENMTRLIRSLRYEPLAGNAVGNGSRPPP